MMADYVAEHGLRICLVDILNACNKRITDLPTLPDYIDNGCPYFCWAHILGRCTFNDCRFKWGHVPRRAITDGFADAVIAMLTLGIQACLDDGGEEGSPGKRQRRQPSLTRATQPTTRAQRGKGHNGEQQ